MENRTEVHVESSNIDSLSLENGVLSVKFKSGNTYCYQNVTGKVFDELVGAASVGRTFNELIKSNPVDYPWFRADAA